MQHCGMHNGTRDGTMTKETERLYLREWRKSAGLSQDQVARATGLNRGSVSRIENGIQDPGVRGLIELARALGCQPGDLFAPPVSAAA